MVNLDMLDLQKIFSQMPMDNTNNGFSVHRTTVATIIVIMIVVWTQCKFIFGASTYKSSAMYFLCYKYKHNLCSWTNSQQKIVIKSSAFNIKYKLRLETIFHL